MTDNLEQILRNGTLMRNSSTPYMHLPELQTLKFRSARRTSQTNTSKDDSCLNGAFSSHRAQINEPKQILVTSKLRQDLLQAPVNTKTSSYIKICNTQNTQMNGENKERAQPNKKNGDEDDVDQDELDKMFKSMVEEPLAAPRGQSVVKQGQSNQKVKQVNSYTPTKEVKEIKDEIVPIRKPKRRIILNNWNTIYSCVQVAGENCGFKVQRRDHNLRPSADTLAAYRLTPGLFANVKLEEFDIVWFDLAIDGEVVKKLKPHQRISQWPGIQVLTHKNRMANNLTIMKRHYPEEYNFFPESFLLPEELPAFRQQFGGWYDSQGNNQQTTFIVKPSVDCQGRGIYLMREFEQLRSIEHSVVAQTYIDNPYLIDGLKFDLRLYVLLYGVNPLRIYFFEDGLARFATNTYVRAQHGDINDVYTHLTNFAINKHNEKYNYNNKKQNTDIFPEESKDPEDGEEEKRETEPEICHKRSYKEILRIMEREGRDISKLQAGINDLLIKSIITGQNYLNHVFKTVQPDNLENQTCFQILGFDILIDDQMKPWLLEVNQSPSFQTDSELDKQIKQKCTEDTFKLLNMTSERKWEYMEIQEKRYFERLMVPYNKSKAPIEELDKERMKIDEKRQLAENQILSEGNGYTQIYPVIGNEEANKKYKKFLNKAASLQNEFTHGKIKLNFANKEFDQIVNRRQAAEQEQKKQDNKYRNRSTNSQVRQSKDNWHGSLKVNKQSTHHDQGLRGQSEINDQLVSLRKQIEFETQKKIKLKLEEARFVTKNRFYKKRISQAQKSPTKTPQKINNSMFGSSKRQSESGSKKDQVSQFQISSGAGIEYGLGCETTQKSARQEYSDINALQIQPQTSSQVLKIPRKSIVAAQPDQKPLQVEIIEDQLLKIVSSRYQNQYLKLLSPKSKSSPKSSTLSANFFKDSSKDDKSVKQIKDINQGVLETKREMEAKKTLQEKHKTLLKKSASIGNVVQKKNPKKERDTSQFDILRKKIDIPSRIEKLRDHITGNKKQNMFTDFTRKKSPHTQANKNSKSSKVLQSRNKVKEAFMSNQDTFMKSQNMDHRDSKEELKEMNPMLAEISTHQKLSPEKRKRANSKSQIINMNDLRAKRIQLYSDDGTEIKNLDLEGELGLEEEEKAYLEPEVMKEEDQEIIVEITQVKETERSIGKQQSDLITRVLKAARDSPELVTDLSKSNSEDGPDKENKEQKTQIYEEKLLEQQDDGEVLILETEPGELEPVITEDTPIQASEAGQKNSSGNGNQEEESESKMKRTNSSYNGFVTFNTKTRRTKASRTPRGEVVQSRLTEASPPPVKVQEAYIDDDESKNSINIIDLAKLIANQMLKEDVSKVERKQASANITPRKPRVPNLNDNARFTNRYVQSRSGAMNKSKSPSPVRIAYNQMDDKTPHVSSSIVIPGTVSSSKMSSAMFNNFMSPSRLNNKDITPTKKAEKQPTKIRRTNFFSPSKQVSIKKTMPSKNLEKGTSPTKRTAVTESRYFEKKAVVELQQKYQKMKDMSPKKKTDFASQSFNSNLSSSPTKIQARSPVKVRPVDTTVLNKAKVTGQAASRKKFVQLIEDLKAQGKDPVFNPTQDFITNEHIGHGTYATIKKCTHKYTGYIVALKSYEKRLLTRKTQLMAIHREIYILAGMDHPNIMRLFEVMDSKSHVHLVMELCQGKNLSSYIDKYGDKYKIAGDKVLSYLKERDALKMFKQIFSAVRYMHGLELIHRDIKIQNIIITSGTLEIKFTDFGFATNYQPQSGIQELSGQPIIKNIDVANAKTKSGQGQDVLNMGIILCQMLYGGIPSWHKTDQETTITLIPCEPGNMPHIPESPKQVSESVQQLLIDILTLEVKDCEEVAQHTAMGRIQSSLLKKRIDRHKNEEISTQISSKDFKE